MSRSRVVSSQPAWASAASSVELRRRGPRLNAGVSLLRFGRLHGPPGGWTFRVSHGSRGASIREEPGASAPGGRNAGALRRLEDATLAGYLTDVALETGGRGRSRPLAALDSDHATR